MYCGTDLPAGINFRQVRDAVDNKVIGNRCYNKCKKKSSDLDPKSHDVEKKSEAK